MGGRVTSARRATDSISADAILAVVPHLATKADVMEVRASVAAVETAVIKWIIATTLATGGLAFTIAKFVH